MLTTHGYRIYSTNQQQVQLTPHNLKSISLVIISKPNARLNLCQVDNYWWTFHIRQTTKGGGSDPGVYWDQPA